RRTGCSNRGGRAGGSAPSGRRGLRLLQARQWTPGAARVGWPGSARAGLPGLPAIHISGIIAPVAVLEGEGDRSLDGDLLRFGDGRRAVVRVDEVQVRCLQELSQTEPEHALPRGIEPLEVAVEAGDAQQVGG